MRIYAYNQFFDEISSYFNAAPQHFCPLLVIAALHDATQRVVDRTARALTADPTTHSLNLRPQIRKTGFFFPDYFDRARWYVTDRDVHVLLF